MDTTGLTEIWNQLVVFPLEAILRFLAEFAGSGGIAIILMTLIIKGLLLPLSLKQTNSMKAMQALQPEIADLKKKFKDREKITQETMRLYKERGVNPASGCLPMLPTMVVLFGLYWALQNLSQHDPEFQEPFLWVQGLNHPDTFTLPGLDVRLPGILPIVMAITQYFSSKMMTMPTQDPQQQTMNRMMTIMMPAMMLFWGVTFPAGLVLYWFISNLFEMVRLYFTMGPRSLGSVPSFGSWRPGGAPKTDQSSADGNGAQTTRSASSGQARSAGSGQARSAGPGQAEQTGTDIPGGGPRANGRPHRPRNKRGRRSGRR